ncbi:hypothetical protein KDA23_05190 [Candidatus Saccharibacteria bacterium]|nr:hypothetical protein [Candidatus Saccharibacteria bacterium]
MAELQPNGKETIYVDVDDEITTIIDKVAGAKQKVVALVLPKRASVFQSIVNMKLLKRSAESANKNVVLITSETGLMPLAGAVGLYVAKTPQSKPEIPVAPVVHDGNQPEDDDTIALDDEELAAAGETPVGDLAKGTAVGVAAAAAIDTVELDDEPEATPTKKEKGKKGKVGKQPKVPSFSKFQKKIARAVVLLIVFIIGWYLSVFVLPKATVAIGTDATDYNSSLDITLDTNADSVDVASSTIPAQAAQEQKTYTAQVSATGEKNNGDKATGSVKLTAQKCSGNPFVAPSDVPAGTGVSANGLTYITQESTSFFGTGSSGGCYQYSSAGKTDITAQTGGSNFNINDESFTVSGRSDVSGTGSASGGTDDIIKVVSQDDIDKAKKQLDTSDSTNIKNQLEQQLRQNNLYPLLETFNDGKPTVSSSPSAGTQADTVTVTEVVTYTMFGARRDYLDQLIKNDIQQQIDPATQSIIDDGLDQAAVSATSCNDKSCKISLQTTATVGPNIDISALKEEIKGKKSGYVKSLIGNLPGVTNVDVKLSPFWVSSVPNNTEKITIQVGKASGSQ